MDGELKISVQTQGWYRKLFGGEVGANAALQFIKECGFDTLDYNFNDMFSVNLDGKETIKAFCHRCLDDLLECYRPLKEAMKYHEVVLGQAHASFPLYFEEADDMNEYMIRVVEKECAICEYLECPVLVIHPYFCTDREKEKKINLDMYRNMIPAAKKYGIKLCLENMWWAPEGRVTVAACGDASEACWYIDALNEEAGEDVFGYCLDVGHATLTCRDIRQEIRTLGHRLIALHIHDNDGQNDLHLIPFTQRTSLLKTCTDWDSFLEGLRDINYKGSINFETCTALENIPSELVPSMLKLINDIGCYFKKKLG